MTDYPSTLPAPQVSDYALETAMPISAVTFERGNRRQRRGAKKDRQVFTLSFVFSTAQLTIWQLWANQYGYDWHSMDLESPYSGLSIEGLTLIPHTVRYISDIALQLVAPDVFRVSVTAEMDVSTTPDGVLAPSGNWYVAGTPASPATDTITAGTPGSPAADFIIAGSPALPAA